MELYQGYDPRYRTTADGFLFSAHVYISDANANAVVIIWEIEKAYFIIEKLFYNNFTKLIEET